MVPLARLHCNITDTDSYKSCVNVMLTFFEDVDLHLI